MFGFSRGAFAARSLAGFVSRVGIILRDKLHLVEAAYRVYEEGTDPADTLLSNFLRQFADKAMVQSIEDENALPIHLIGVWDTVGALGLPWRRKKFTAEHTEHHQTEVPPTVIAARHAMALHELRKPFKLMLWTNREKHPNLEQVWFPGAHADVGGGYREDESGLSDNALRWMANAAAGFGLRLDPATSWLHGSAGKEVLHHEIRKWFCWLSPTARPQLQTLLDAPGPTMAALDNALYFHRSVSRRLLNPAARDYKFFRSSVNECLERADQLATQLFVRSRLLGFQPQELDQAMPKYPEEFPFDPPEPWWQTVSLAELEKTTVVIDEFTQESKQPPTAPPEQFARAVALHMLCVDEGILDVVIGRADARSEAYRPELRLDGDYQKQDAFAAWLARSEDIGVGLLRCAELLPETLRKATGAVVKDFLQRVEGHINAHREFIIHKRGVVFKSMKKLTLKKP